MDAYFQRVLEKIAARLNCPTPADEQQEEENTIPLPRNINPDVKTVSSKLLKVKMNYK